MALRAIVSSNNLRAIVDTDSLEPVTVFSDIKALTEFINLEYGIDFLNLEAVNILLDADSKNLFFTPETQDFVHSGDKGLEFVPKIQEQTLNWGGLTGGGTGRAAGDRCRARSVCATRQDQGHADLCRNHVSRTDDRATDVSDEPRTRGDSRDRHRQQRTGDASLRSA